MTLEPRPRQDQSRTGLKKPAHKLWMTGRRAGLFPCLLASLGLLLPYQVDAALLAPSQPMAGLLGLLDQRAFLQGADQVCTLFDTQTRLAMTAGVALARNSALRAGYDRNSVHDLMDRAKERGRLQTCDDPALKALSEHVSHAFAGFSMTARITFPGSQRPWRADRSGPEFQRWRLLQAVRLGFDRACLGYYGTAQDPALTVALMHRPGEAPYGARLIYRNMGLTPDPWLLRPGAKAFSPPVGEKKMILAAERTLNPEGFRMPLGPEDPEAKSRELRKDMDRYVFRFKDDVGSDLAQLDPREQIFVEFLFADHTVMARFEVGDFAPAAVFLTMKSKTGS